MSLKKRLRTILVCVALEFGVLSGVPMRPDEIRALMDQINQPKLAQALPASEEPGMTYPSRPTAAAISAGTPGNRKLTDRPGSVVGSSRHNRDEDSVLPRSRRL